MTRNYYEILGVEKDATTEEIIKSYRKLSLLHHPDRNQHRGVDSTAIFQEIKMAHFVLSDPRLRAEYDANCNGKDAISGWDILCFLKDGLFIVISKQFNAIVAKIKKPLAHRLQTHTWHAKRFEMIKLWGFKLPLRCYQRGVRPFMKAAKNDVVMFDDSYFRLLRFHFNSLDQLEIFKQNYSKIRNSNYASLKELRTSSSGIQQVFSIQSETANDVILSVHPLFFKRPLELLTKLTGLSFRELGAKELERRLKREYGIDLPLTAYDGDSCWVTDETNLYSMFSMYGKNVIPSLFRHLNLANDDEPEMIEFKQIHEQWRDFCQNDSIGDLSNGTCFSLLVKDPRLSSTENSNRSMDVASTSTQIMQSSLLFDRRVLRELLSSSITEGKLNNLKSIHVDSTKLKYYKIPVIVSFWNWCSTNHFKVLLPASTACVFFSHFNQNGIEIGSLSDRFILCNEISDCAYPFLWLPLTIEKPLYRWKRYYKFKEAVFKDCGKWNSLKKWAYIVDNPNCLAYIQSLINLPHTTINDSELLQLVDALVPVRLMVSSRGCITDDDLIYEWQSEVLMNGIDNDELVEESSDEDTAERKIPNEQATIGRPAIAEQSHYHERILNEEVVIGRLTFAEQSHYHGRVEALGYIELKAFLKLRNSGGKVRVRNPKGTKFVNACVKTIYSE